MATDHARRLHRKRLRTELLPDLTQEKVALFDEKWNWLLKGWGREANRCPPLILEKASAWTPSGAVLIAAVKNMIESIGARAVAAEMTDPMAHKRSCWHVSSRSVWPRASHIKSSP